MSYGGSEFLTGLEERLQTLQNNLNFHEVDFFPDRIMALATPDPDDLDWTIRKFAQMGILLGGEPQVGAGIEQGALGGVADMFGAIPEDTIASYTEATVNPDGVANWEGEARDAYVEHFIKPYRESGITIRRQRLLCNILQMAAEAERELYSRTRKDISEAVDKAIVLSEAVEDALDCAGSQQQTLTVVGAVATISAAKKGVELVAMVVAAGASVAASYLGEEPVPNGEFNFTADTAYELSEQIDDFTYGMESTFMDQAAKIKDTLSDIGAATTGDFRASLIGPQIAGAENSNGKRRKPMDFDDEGNAFIEDSYRDGFKPK